MAIFNSYVSLPEGTGKNWGNFSSMVIDLYQLGESSRIVMGRIYGAKTSTEFS